ncbi:MAG: thioredoxin family protein [Deferrisomatales bacterium]
MARPRRQLRAPALILVGLVALGWAVARYGADLTASPSGAALPPAADHPLQAGQRVTFVELGSLGCKPCEAMKPVLEAVRQRFPEQVEVIFHDVKRDPSAAGRYRVRLIPTQVFLLPDGSEFFRHEGYFAEGEVMAVLARMGVR